LRSERKPSILAPADTTALDEDNDNYPHEYEDEDADAADDRALWMSSRRPGAQKSLQSDLANEKDTILELPGISATTGLASPVAAMTTLRDRLTPKIQHLQQIMHLILLNPLQILRFDKMPTLPDDQYYLPTAPMIRRINNLVGNNRPDSAKEQDYKWWDLFSGRIPASPPTYEDIFPQGDVDAKRALAVQAAAVAVADNKCGEVFDQAESSTTAQKRTVRIDQKHTITREQQDQLRLAHAKKVKRLGYDRNLLFIWVCHLIYPSYILYSNIQQIPLLVIMLAMLYNRVVGRPTKESVHLAEQRLPSRL
jgi:hypothetical protein